MKAKNLTDNRDDTIGASDVRVPDIKMMVKTALFTALMVIGAYIRFPIGPVPIALTSFFVLTAGLFLGAKWGLLSVVLYLLLGAVGLPVFTGGGGLMLLAGPTGGYLFGYGAAVVVVGWIAGPSRRVKKTGTLREPLWDIVALIAGTVCIYCLGIVQLKFVMGIGWREAFFLGVLPFLIGDGIKIAAAAGVKRAL